MAELADALDLGSSAARRAGSSPVPGTRLCGALRSGWSAGSHSPSQAKTVLDGEAASLTPAEQRGQFLTLRLPAPVLYPWMSSAKLSAISSLEHLHRMCPSSWAMVWR
jgi:hypothetical protein